MSLVSTSFWKRPFRTRWTGPGLVTLRGLALERLEDRTLLAGHTLATASLLSFTAPPTALVQTASAADFLVDTDAVDLYRVHLDAGDRVRSSLSTQAVGSALN